MKHAAFDEDIVKMEWVGGCTRTKKSAHLELVLPTFALTHREGLERDVIAATKTALGVDKVELEVLSNVLPAAGSGKEQQALPGIQNVVLIASGKGGVGKSTVAANFAAALAKLGCKVGLLDADVYGPSVPTMLGIGNGARPGTVPGEASDRPKLLPMTKHGLKLMSMGFLVDMDQPMVWRGPMIASASMQMFKDVQWDELDYLVVDLPPGTGDIHLTIAQQVLVTGAVIVSTPQDVALADVIRAKNMFDKVGIPSLGIVENMSYFVCGKCDERHEIFAHGGAKKAGEKLGLPFLGEIPIELGVRTAGDDGMPAVLHDEDSVATEAFMTLAKNVATRLAVIGEANMKQSAGPTISISGAPKKPGPAGGLPILS